MSILQIFCMLSPNKPAMIRLLLFIILLWGSGVPDVLGQIPTRQIIGSYEFTATIGGGFSGLTRTKRVLTETGEMREETEHLCISDPPDGYRVHKLDMYKDGTAVYDEEMESEMHAYPPDFSIWEGSWAWRSDTLVVTLDHTADEFLEMDESGVHRANRQPLPEVRELWFIPEKEGRDWVLLRVDEGNLAYFRKEVHKE